MKQFFYHVSELGKRIVVTLTPFLVYYVAVLIFLSPPVTSMFSFFNDNEQRVKTAITKKILSEYCGDRKLAKLFMKVGNLYNIDPFFLYSVADVDSNLEKNKVTEKEDGTKLVGLMQINVADYSDYLQENLLNCEINLRLGANELRNAINYGKGNMMKTLAVYHANSSTSKYGQATLDYIENVRKNYSDIQRSEKLYIQENYDLFDVKKNPTS